MQSPNKNYHFWLDLFTEETWLEAARHGFTVTGFSEKRRAMVQRVEPGDLLVCYLTGRSTYIGLLRVTGPAFEDHTRIWSSKEFPRRLPIKPEVILKPDQGVPVRSLSDHLSYFKGLSHPDSNAWTGWFRGSPARITPEDGQAIEFAVREAAKDDSRVLNMSSLPPIPSSRKRTPSGTTNRTKGRIVKSPSQMINESQPAFRAIDPEEEVLAKRLKEAAFASDDSARFESALADAFQFLGFRSEHRSGSGDTDVLVVAPIGEDGYKAVVDGKSNRQGRVSNSQIDWYALQRHRDRHEAEHILVVAGGFSGGELTRDAERSEAALLTTDSLSEILRLHVRTPFSLPALRDLFRYPGQPELPLGRLREHSNETARLQHLLPDIIDEIDQAYRYGFFDPVNVDSLLMPLVLRRQGRTYSREEISSALESLCIPQLGILRRVGDGRYSLQMSKETMARRLRALVAMFDSPGEHSQVPIKSLNKNDLAN